MLAATAMVLLSALPARAQTFAPFGASLAESLDAIRLDEIALRRHIGRRKRRPHRHRIRVAPARTLNPSTSDFPVRGLDVSAYQGDIDWAKVAQAPEHYAFVYLRANHGLDPDDHLAKNWAEARAAGLRVGAYQFYDMCEDATEQAALFVKQVPVEPDALPEVVDIESSKECPDLQPKDVFLRNLKVFTDIFQTVYGRKPMLYVNGDVYKNYFLGENTSYQLWFANPREKPVLPDGHGWNFWQYAWKGRVQGINDTNIDFDVFQGSRADFDAAFPSHLISSAAGTN